jgi:hypothetical protein
MKNSQQWVKSFHVAGNDFGADFNARRSLKQLDQAENYLNER